ncbi:hypothetical protein B0T14DRAFT_500755 [Immersiella caudata]|uniref:G domain-containing protein n=1 Tax=Immersiella caudata TaxID=314043 RepID=A0AA39WAE3_9PEZI|nr:hypothetical protein B0T14DRAFT_500755 [Immersiella caudata]
MSAPSVILLLGPMRSGKTAFVRRLTGKGDEGIPTSECKTYDATLSGKVYRIIDTPGFDDSPRANLSVLKDIAAELSRMNKQRLTVGGVIYFHRITDLRLTGSARINIEIFERICGAQFLPRSVFVTSMWNMIDNLDRAKYEKLDASLRQKYGRLRSKFLKFESDKTNSAQTVLLAAASSRAGQPPQLEAEVIRSGLSASSVRKTEAGKVIVREMNKSSCAIL